MNLIFFQGDPIWQDRVSLRSDKAIPDTEQYPQACVVQLLFQSLNSLGLMRVMPQIG